MRLSLQILYLLTTFLSTPIQAQTSSTKATFTNTNRLLFDTNGNQIDAYGSKINLLGGKYYLYGNSFSTKGVVYGMKSYSSTDLTNWVYEGFLYDTSAATQCLGPVPQSGGCGRPHILYNAKQGKYVLWANALSTGYSVATSDSPSGPFTFLDATTYIDPMFSGLQPADFAIEDLGNGEAYAVFSILNFRSPDAGSIWPPLQQSMHIAPLTDDFMNMTAVTYNVTSSAFDEVDQEAESPDLFKRNGTYYVAASNTCGYCNGTLGLIYRSDSIQGPWTRQVISGNSCEGQVEGVLPIPSSNGTETTYLWHSTSVPGGLRVGFGGHIFQPLQFAPDGSVLDLDCDANAQFPVEFQAINGSTSPSRKMKSRQQRNPAAKRASSAGSIISSPSIADYTPVCDSDQFNLFQTWVQPTSGTLNSLSVNVAKSIQTVPLIIQVFRFPNVSTLISFGYKWESLGSVSINASSLSYTFDATAVPLNTSVSAGDNLGFSIAGIDYAPYCHLEYDIGEDEGGIGSVLLQQGQGQNSFRGVNGTTSPVYVRKGKGIKFFAEMN